MDPTYLGQPMQAPTKQPRRRGVSGRALLLVAVLLVAVLAGVGLMLAKKDTAGPLSQRLTLRFDALEDILADGKKNASSDKLKKITSEATLLMLGDRAAIEAALPAKKPKKIPSLVAAEDSESSITRLKDAKINATYDTAYTSELTAKLETTSALVRELHSASRSKSLKNALNTTYQHLVGLQKDLAAN